MSRSRREFLLITVFPRHKMRRGNPSSLTHATHSHMADNRPMDGAGDVPRNRVRFLDIPHLDNNNNNNDDENLAVNVLRRALEIVDQPVQLADAVMEDSRANEFKIREALAKLQLKREIMLNQIYILADVAEDEFQLKDALRVHTMFTQADHEPHPLLSRALEFIELNTIRALVRLSTRFQIRLDQLNERMSRDTLAIRELNGWREVQDEDGQQYYINNEGLRRVDLPIEWWREEANRERRYRDFQSTVGSIEEFVLSRTKTLLAQISDDVQKCRKVAEEIEEELINHNETDEIHENLVVARRMIEGVAALVSEKVLEFFYYETPCDIPGIPTVGVTNAHAHRRLRTTPNFERELEEFFDEVEEVE